MLLQCTDAFVTVAAIDVEVLVVFYTRLFSKAPVNHILNVYAEFQLPSLRFAIFKPEETNQQEFENAARSSMSLCLEVQDLEDAIAHLTVLGYPPPGETSIASHGREIYAYDPGRNRLILHQSLKRAGGTRGPHASGN